MTARKYVTIWCDVLGCNNWHGGDATYVVVARRNAAKEGWTSKAGKDICPLHDTEPLK